MEKSLIFLLIILVAIVMLAVNISYYHHKLDKTEKDFIRRDIINGIYILLIGLILGLYFLPKLINHIIQ